jgi:hypothetical protein
MRQDHFFTLRLTHSVRRLALALGLSLPFAAPPSQAQDLIPWRSAWKYADDGVNRYTQTPPYYHPDYNEALWKSGSGRFGYGGDGESTTILFGPNASNKFPTTYFRREFTWDGQKNPEADTLLLEFSRDDGAMIYLNGTLIERSNMPAGTVGHTTRASTAVSDQAEWQLLQKPLDPSLLLPGKNVLAVGVHQNAPDSSDLGFDLRLAFARQTQLLSQTVLLPPPHDIQSLLNAFDVNGDGAPDLFTTKDKRPGTQFDLRLSLGRTTFAKPVAIDPDYYDLKILLPLNLNGDARPDLLGSNLENGGEIRVYQNDGAGRFTRTAVIDSGTTLDLNRADLNGDGHDDIVEVGFVANAPTLRWRRNQQNGSFAEAVVLLTLPTGPSGTNFSKMAISDANGDRRPDILMSAPVTSDIRLLLNQGGENPTFTATVAATGLPYVRGLAAADIDGDGDDDFVAVNRTAAATSSTGLLQTLINDGTGAYSRPPVPLPLDGPGSGAATPRLHDLTGDGRPDFVFATTDPGRILLYQNDGRGNWVHRRAYESPLHTFDNTSFTIADLDADGQPDIAQASRSRFEPLSWYRNAAGSPPRITSFTATPDTINAATQVMLNWQVEGSSKLSLSPAASLPADATSVRLPVDRETTFTLTAENNWGTTTSTLTVQLANLRWSPLIAGPEITSRYSFGAQLDMNDDGLLDVAYSGFTPGEGKRGIYWAPVTADGSFGPPQLALPGTPLHSPLATDLNGDRSPDLLASTETGGLRWVPVPAAGPLGEPRTILPANPSRPLSLLAAADFDGDGDTDVAVPEGSEWLRLHLNDGTGSFLPGLLTPLPPGFRTDELRSADLDRDGRADLIFLQDAGSTYLGWNNGPQGFALVATVAQPVTSPDYTAEVRFVHGADLNGDGHQDMLTIQSVFGGDIDGPNLFLEMGQGDRQLGTRGGTLLFSSSPLGNFAGVSTVDLDRDGDLDLIVSHLGRDVPLRYALNNGLGRFSSLVNVTSQTIGSNGAYQALVGDIEGDGDPDIVTFFDYSVAALFNNGPPPPVIQIQNSANLSEDGADASLRINVSGLTRPQRLEFAWLPTSTATANEIIPGPPSLITPVPGQPGRWSLLLEPGTSPVILTFRTPDDPDEEEAETILLQFSSSDPAVLAEVPGTYGAIVTLTIRTSDFTFPGVAEISPLPGGLTLLQFSRLLPRPHAVESSSTLKSWSVLEILNPLPDGTLDYLVLPDSQPHTFFRARDTTIPVGP